MRSRARGREGDVGGGSLAEVVKPTSREVCPKNVLNISDFRII